MAEKLNVLLQCSSKKQKDGHFKNSCGQKVIFGGQPHLYDGSEATPARPDDIDDISGKTWRQLILEYNITYCQSKENPLNLYRAYELYTPRNPYKEVGSDLFNHPKFDFYIISDGWGIVPANFYLPQYDIVFSNDNEFSARAKNAIFKDIYCLDDTSKQDLICIAGEKCQNFFEEWSKNYKGKRYVYEHKLSKYISKRTWVYQAAQELIKKNDLYLKRARLL